MLVGQWVEVEQHVQEVLELSKMTKNERQIMRALVVYGNLKFHKGQYDEALSYYDEQRALAQKLNDKKEIANYLNNAAVIYIHFGDFDKAMSFCEQALKSLDFHNCFSFLLASFPLLRPGRDRAVALIKSKRDAN